MSWGVLFCAAVLHGTAQQRMDLCSLGRLLACEHCSAAESPELRAARGASRPGALPLKRAGPLCALRAAQALFTIGRDKRLVAAGYEEFGSTKTFKPKQAGEAVEAALGAAAEAAALAQQQLQQHGSSAAAGNGSGSFRGQVEGATVVVAEAGSQAKLPAQVGPSAAELHYCLQLGMRRLRGTQGMQACHLTPVSLPAKS